MLTCLLPIRNAEQYLPLFLAEAENYIDTIIALDDGSIDDTNTMLTNNNLVKTILKNPERNTYSGWDDLSNRNSLLKYLSSQNYSGWVLFLDADEVLDSEDALILKEYIENGILDQSSAYGFRVYRMVNNLDCYYKKPLLVYRLFYFKPGFEIKGAKFHFEPIPFQIEMTNWFPTNFRIKHLSSITREKRIERYNKYKEVDPANKYQSSYENLIDEPKVVFTWENTCYNHPFEL